ncbi:MAG: protease pro-enzyme activation domain-containing protein, partial [Variovorax sp.]
MVNKAQRHVISGSERLPVAGAKAVGDVQHDERFEVTVRVRPKAPADTLASRGVHADTPVGQRQYLTREEYAASHGADPADLAKIGEFAKAHGLVVVESNAARRSVVLSGNAKSFGEAFGVRLQQFEHDGGSYRGRTEAISVPAELSDIVQGVFGLDDRPQAHPH